MHLLLLQMGAKHQTQSYPQGSPPCCLGVVLPLFSCLKKGVACQVLITQVVLHLQLCEAQAAEKLIPTKCVLLAYTVESYDWTLNQIGSEFQSKAALPKVLFGS